MTARFSRRALLAAGGAGLAAATLAGGLTGCHRNSPAGQTAQLLRSSLPVPEPFRVPLPVPPVKSPVSRSGGVTRYEIVQREAEVELLPGTTTTITGYDGIFPGPTIEARRGERVSVRHHNESATPTVVHLHGGNTAAASDGYPVDLVLPTEGADRFLHGGHNGHHGSMLGDVSHGVRDYEFDHDQPAATLWYHDHRMDFTGAQVWRGLAGMHLIRDDIEDGLPLPRGDRELPLLITDRSFAEDGSLSYPAADPELIGTPGVTGRFHSGVLGDVILVNGAPWPELEVDAARYRLRMINGSNARRYAVSLDPPPPGGPVFTQIGSDGGLLERPLQHDQIVLAAGERFDCVVDFSGYRPGTAVTMVNRLGNGPTAQVMRFRVARRAADDSRIPERLAEIEPLQPGPDVIRRDWRFERRPGDGMMMWAINGKYYDPDRMDARAELGRTEIWRFYTDLHHPVHVHLSPFQVLNRNGTSPGRYDAGWKDTIDLRPTEYAEVAIRFTNYRGAYLLHCHNLEHEDMGMMAAFEVG